MEAQDNNWGTGSLRSCRMRYLSWYVRDRSIPLVLSPPVASGTASSLDTSRCANATGGRSRIRVCAPRTFAADSLRMPWVRSWRSSVSSGFVVPSLQHTQCRRGVPSERTLPASGQVKCEGEPLLRVGMRPVLVLGKGFKTYTRAGKLPVAPNAANYAAGFLSRNCCANSISDCSAMRKIGAPGGRSVFLFLALRAFLPPRRSYVSLMQPPRLCCSPPCR